jgi:hypothetical protein
MVQLREGTILYGEAGGWRRLQADICRGIKGMNYELLRPAAYNVTE